MRVYIVNSMCGSGSTGRIVSDLYNMLIENGHEVKIGYGIGIATRVNRCDTLKINNKFGYYLHNVSAKLTDKTGLFSTYQTEKLVADIEKFAPDIIHLHNLHGYWINYQVLFTFLKTQKIHVVWTLHDCWAFTGHCAHFDLLGCDRWKKQCYSCPQPSAYPRCLFKARERKNFELKKGLFTGLKSMTIVTPSLWLSMLVNQSFLRKYEIITINNGIDLQIFKRMNSHFREKYGLSGKCIVLAVANMWGPKKGLNDVWKLSELLDDDYKIVMVGLTDEQKKATPKAIIALGRTESIIQLAEIYSESDVFVNLTYEDTFPTVNIESLACGTPVVTYRTGGSTEIVTEKTGVIVEKGSVEKVVYAIEKARKLNRDDCVARASHYDKRDRYQEYFDLYIHCMRSGRELCGSTLDS